MGSAPHRPSIIPFSHFLLRSPYGGSTFCEVAMTNCANKGVIVQYTTPTILINFPTIDTSTITEAYLVFKTAGATVLEKDLAAATVEEKKVSWRLSQVETGKFALNTTVEIYCDWKLSDGTRGRSLKADYWIVETGKAEVI